jgi:hypothetical protein
VTVVLLAALVPENVPIPVVLQFAVALASVPAYQRTTRFVAFVAVPLAAVALTRHPMRHDEVVPVPDEMLVQPVILVGAVVLPLR